ncbi:hypothetical protein OH76DRAFT_1396649 [Lentinus brumalis]|uniref:Uncharacterized protein n=1 Tax=Lentinus brumalis TaxID=2498619 RepID=A0A371DUW0_9APHY|nr:hypothetical protein OH76DRAFT_1396649 [Polyporus brumalis]
MQGESLRTPPPLTPVSGYSRVAHSSAALDPTRSSDVQKSGRTSWSVSSREVALRLNQSAHGRCDGRATGSSQNTYIGLPPLLGHGDILGAENHSKDRAALQGLLPTQAFLGGKDVPRQERPSPVCDRPIQVRSARNRHAELSTSASSKTACGKKKQ